MLSFQRQLNRLVLGQGLHPLALLVLADAVEELSKVLTRGFPAFIDVLAKGILENLVLAFAAIGSENLRRLDKLYVEVERGLLAFDRHDPSIYRFR